MVGGVPFVLQGLVASAAGLATTLWLTPIDIWAVPSRATVILSAVYLGYAFLFTSYLVSSSTRRLISMRRDLEARNEEISEKTLELSRALADTANIAQLTRIVNTTLDVDEVIEKVVASLRSHFDFNQVVMALVEDDGATVRLHRYLGAGFDDEVVTRLKDVRLPLDESQSWLVRPITRNEPIFLPNIGADDVSRLAPADREIYELNPSRGLLGVPLESEASVIGAIYFSHTEIGFDLNKDALTKIENRVVPIATAIRNARLFEAMKRARAAAESANATKGRFLANMSHELRTPLNAILGYSEMLMEDAEETGDKQTRDDLAKIRSAGKHLLALISDVLDLSKIEAGKMTFSIKEFEVSAMIDSVVDTIQPIADRNRNQLEIIGPETALGTMAADETKVCQALFNLLSNACKFTEDGSITLKVERRETPTAERVVFTVRDTGIGIPPDRLDEIFQEFSQADLQTHSQFGGTGLGLPISRRFARMMGGEITATSQPGRGSTFVLDLPARAEHAPASTNTSVEQVSSPISDRGSPGAQVAEEK